MSQRVAYLVGQQVLQKQLPDANVAVVPGVYWGNASELFTPAYWLAQTWMVGNASGTHNPYLSHGGLVDEIAFCLLGGYGITAELAIAAFRACQDAGLINRRSTSQNDWLAALSRPVTVGQRQVRYRFPRKKSQQLALAMSMVDDIATSTEDALALRRRLLAIPGIGYKTASWIVRNVLDSDEVAILDIHLLRAGTICGLFNISDRLPRDYLELEQRFLQFSNAIGVRPALLDCIIWEGMRTAGQLPLRLLNMSRFGITSIEYEKQLLQPRPIYPIPECA